MIKNFIDNLNNKIFLFLFFLSSVLLLFSFYNFILSMNTDNFKLSFDSDIKEEYSENIAKITDLNEFKSKINNKIKEKNLSGIEIPILVDDFVRKKFFHKYDVISWNENWFINLIEYFLPQYRLNNSLDAEEIIKKNYAICNQQSIVFQNIIKDLGYEYASVRFNIPNLSHFANAVKVNNQWYFFDTHKEPEYNRKDPEVFDKIIQGDFEILQSLYGKKLDYGNNIEITNSEMIVLTHINNFPAKRGLIIQKLSFIISWYGWIICFVLALLYINLFKKIKGKNS